MLETIQTATTPDSCFSAGNDDGPVLTTGLVQVYHRAHVHVIPAFPAALKLPIDTPAQPLVWLSTSHKNGPDIIEHLGIPIRTPDAAAVETIINGFRMVAFRAAEEYAPNWLSQCLQMGRIPILIGNAVALPFSSLIDYSSAIFVLGEEPIELTMLGQLRDLPGHDLNHMAMRCTNIWNGHYTARGIDDGIRAIRSLQTSCMQPCPIHDSRLEQLNRFPAFTNEGKLVREDDLFRSMWLELGRQFPTDNSKPIICYGAGRFLKRMLDCVEDIPNGPRILGVADDNAVDGQTIHQIPIRTLDGFSLNEFAAILLATDSAEDVLAGRCKKEYGDAIPLLRPSRLMTIKSVQHITDTLPPSSLLPNSELRIPRSEPTRPRKLEAIVVCVGYGDMLSWTLRWNRPQFDNIVIVTSSEDYETQEVAKRNDTRLVISDRYRQDSATFNKGNMLNDGFAALDLDDWVMVTDADILFSPGLRQRLMQRLLHRNCLYYATRLDVPTECIEQWLTDFMNQPDMINALPFDRPGRNRMPWGYFQLVNAQSRTLRHMGHELYGESFETACDVDYAFQEQWHPSMKILLPELTVHIPHGPEGINWSGRKSPGLRH